MSVTHVEMYDSRSFCGEDGDMLYQGDWHGTPMPTREFLRVDCTKCLQRIALFGTAAQERLKRIKEGR